MLREKKESSVVLIGGLQGCGLLRSGGSASDPCTSLEVSICLLCGSVSSWGVGGDGGRYISDYGRACVSPTGHG